MGPVQKNQSTSGSLVGMERFAKRHRQTLNDLLGMDFGKTPSDSTFRLLLAQLDVPGFETLLRDWMEAQPGVADALETLVCDGKTLRGSIAENDTGASRFIVQVSLMWTPKTEPVLMRASLPARLGQEKPHETQTPQPRADHSQAAHR